MEEDEYGDIPDEDFMEAFSQASQHLPQLPEASRPAKRRRISNGGDDDVNGVPRRSRESTGSRPQSSAEGQDDDDRAKKKKYKIHIAHKDVPAAKIMGATQAEALPSSSPYRIRGPIYKKPRPEPPKPPSPKPQLPQAFFARSNTSLPASNNSVQPRPSNLGQAHQIHHELEDLPDDAFSTPEKEEGNDDIIFLGSSPVQATQGGRPRQRLVAPQQGLRQTTLFGGRAPAIPTASQIKKVHNFIVDKPPEPPTHHILNQDALKTWVYPTNLGAIRDYQYSIVKHGLFNNLLVALPTGLGKTFIAATIMYNYYRWTRDAQILFVAPTKPLVAQQVDACFNIVGIPRSDTTMLTGEQHPTLRAEEWISKRVFFMTPQTVQNDMSSGIADPKRIVLLVVDEAHRATGDYAYTKLVAFLRRFNTSFRVLALTATPGSSVEAVQGVVDNLEIAKVEIRTEESIDIQQYVHKRDIDEILIDPSDEMVLIKTLFAKALQPVVNKLCSVNAYYIKDPMSHTVYGLNQAKQMWNRSDAGRRANPGLKGMVNALFTTLASTAHSIKLLNFHGIRPFFSKINDFRTQSLEAKKPAKYATEIIKSPDFNKMMDTLRLWVSKDDFISHPKLTHLCDTVLNHFMDAGEGRLGSDAPPSSTRVIVFSEYRDSAEDIVKVLNKHGPMIRPSVFVGQAEAKNSEGMNQAKQQETIKQFKEGIFNVIVATSIGEEGLDIGSVDLIVCYDSSGSPIRMLQRMGRTGRKRRGHIVMLLMRGKEQDSFAKAKDNYSSMQKLISDGARFNFRHDLSVRIIPRDITPVVDKRLLDIPIENTQSTELPEPKRRAAKTKKKPAKKFHMPDGVQTGFLKASRLNEDGVVMPDSPPKVKPKKAPKTRVASMHAPESVFLTPAEEEELQCRFQNVSGNDMDVVSMPDMNAQPSAQRTLRKTFKVPHGAYTRRCVDLFSTLGKSQDPSQRLVKPYGENEPTPDWDILNFSKDEDISDNMPAPRPALDAVSKPTPKPKPQPVAKQARKKGKKSFRNPFIDSDIGNEPAHFMLSQGRALAAAMSDDGLEGEGEDLQLNSEPPSYDIPNSDDLGSLKDFVVDDEAQSSITDRRPAVRSSTTPPISQTPTQKNGQSLFVPTQDTADDDLLDLSQLAGSHSKTTSATIKTPIMIDLSSPVGSDDDDDDDDERPVSRAVDKGKRKRAVVDSDSDE